MKFEEPYLHLKNMSAVYDEIAPTSPTYCKDLLEKEEDVLTKHGRCGVSNLCVLYVVALLFGGFCVAELVGALVGCFDANHRFNALVLFIYYVN